MTGTTTRELQAGTPTTTEELARSAHEQCQRALRRLRVLAREHDDVLLSYAVESVRRAAALNAAQIARD